MLGPTPDKKTPTRRGTSNRNARGGTRDRERRRVWLIDTYRANVDVALPSVLGLPTKDPVPVPLGEGRPAARCYRCAALLTVDTVTADRIIPGCQGGTYRRENIRPACGSCNSETGGVLGASRRRTA